MALLKKTDFLADIQFIDYWDAESFLRNKTVDFLADIQFVDYWDSSFFSKASESGVSSVENWNSDASLDDLDAGI